MTGLLQREHVSPAGPHGKFHRLAIGIFHLFDQNGETFRKLFSLIPPSSLLSSFSASLLVSASLLFLLLGFSAFLLFCFSAFLRIIHFKLFSNGWNLPRAEPHLWMSLLQFSIPNGDVLQNDGRLLLDEPDSISSNQMQSGYFTCFIKIHRSRAHHCMKIRWTLLVLIGVGFSCSSICWDALRNNMYAGKNIVTPCKT